MRELLRRISMELVGIAYCDLTHAERKIVNMLVTHGYMSRDGDNLKLLAK